MTTPDQSSIAPRTAFAQALRAGNADDVRNLLLRYVELRRAINDPIAGGDFGAKPIHAVLRSQNRELVDVLISAGADINARTDWWAGSFGVLDTCAPSFAPFLIERGAHVDAYAASRLGMLDKLRELIAADPTAVAMRGGDGQTPLHVAANIEIATFLLDSGADIDAIDVDHESTSAQYAIGERADVARFLVSRGAKADILLATALGDLARVKQILGERPEAIRTTVNRASFPMKNPRAGGTIYIWTLGGNKNALQIARERGYEEILNLLKSTASEEMKLAFACELGDEIEIGKLLGARPELPKSLGEPEKRRLLAAAEAGKADVVSRMLRLGWPVDVGDDNAVTALHWASWHGNAPMVAELISAGAPIDAHDKTFDGVPLGWAIHGSLNSWRRESGDYKAVVKELVKAGAVPPASGDVVASEEVKAALAEVGAK